VIVVCVLASFVYGHRYLGVDLFASGGKKKAGEGDGPHMSRNQRVGPRECQRI
jgi:hypothetical protein